MAIDPAAYEKFIRSSRWRNICKDIKKQRGNRCEECGYTWELSVHHLTYDRFGGRELPRDLQLLCRKCHEKADEERKRQVHLEIEERIEDQRYQNGFETYMDKKYGLGWERYIGPHLYDEFDQWLEKKDQDYY